MLGPIWAQDVGKIGKFFKASQTQGVQTHVQLHE